MGATLEIVTEGGAPTPTPTPTPTPAPWTLGVGRVGGGTVTLTDGTWPYPYAGQITISSGQPTPALLASPNSGYYFDHWEFDGNTYGNANPVTVPAQSDGSTHTLVAYFALSPTAPAPSPAPAPTPTPAAHPGMGTLEVHAYEDGTEVSAAIEVARSDQGYDIGTYDTPFSLELSALYGPLPLRLTATFKDYPAQIQDVQVLEGQTTSVEFRFVVAVSQCQVRFGNWGLLNPLRDFFCVIQGIPTEG